MNTTELKIVIRKIILENFQQDLTDDLYPDKMPEDMQKQYFEDVVNGHYESFISNPKLMKLLPEMNEESVKEFFAEKYKNALDKLSKNV